MKARRFTDREFRMLLDLFMVTGPWPSVLTDDDNETFMEMITAESHARGYEDWVAAYHEFGGRGKGGA